MLTLPEYCEVITERIIMMSETYLVSKVTDEQFFSVIKEPSKTLRLTLFDFDVEFGNKVEPEWGYRISNIDVDDFQFVLEENIETFFTPDPKYLGNPLIWYTQDPIKFHFKERGRQIKYIPPDSLFH